MKIIITAIIICLFSTSAMSQQNYCHDPKTWNDWEKMVKKFPDDIPLQILHALRIGLCVKVEEGSISFEGATKLINSWSDELIRQRAEKENKTKGLEIY